MIQKVYKVRERTVVVLGLGKVRRKMPIVSSSGFRELRQDADFAAAAGVRFFLTDETNMFQLVLRFDVC